MEKFDMCYIIYIIKIIRAYIYHLFIIHFIVLSIQILPCKRRKKSLWFMADPIFSHS